MTDRKLIRKLNAADVVYFRDAIKEGLERLDGNGASLEAIDAFHHDAKVHLQFVAELGNVLEKRGSLNALSAREFSGIADGYEALQKYRYALYEAGVRETNHVGALSLPTPGW